MNTKQFYQLPSPCSAVNVRAFAHMCCGAYYSSEPDNGAVCLRSETKKRSHHQKKSSRAT